MLTIAVLQKLVLIILKLWLIARRGLSNIIYATKY